MSVSEPSSRVSEANPCSAGGRAGAERTKAKSSAVMETPGLGAARGGPTGTNLVCINREETGSQALAGPWLDENHEHRKTHPGGRNRLGQMGRIVLANQGSVSTFPSRTATAVSAPWNR